mgnify:FL=1
MIFVSVGTQDKSFTRLLELIDKEIDKGFIKDEVIVQSGYTKYNSKNMKILDYVSKDDFNKYIKECDLLITHGGVGTIFTGLENNKKVMVMPRLKEYREHNNNHQLDITDSFEKEGYILSFNNEIEFEEKYKMLDSFKVKKYQSNTLNMIRLVKDFIDNN